MKMETYMPDTRWCRIIAVVLCAIGVFGFNRATQKSKERIFWSVFDVNETEVSEWLNKVRTDPYVNFVEARETTGAFLPDRTFGPEDEWVPVGKKDIDKYIAGRTIFTIKCEFTDSEYLPIAKTMHRLDADGRSVSLYDEARQRIRQQTRDVTIYTFGSGILFIAGLVFGARSLRSRRGNLLPRR
jgi:hypothetical protein